MDNNTKKKVLVVDDDNNLRNVLVDALDSFGYESFGAVNGQEGLSKALEWHPDVIMLDVLMPKMDGWEVVSQLRVDEWGKTAKIIMLTSLGQIENVAKALDKKIFTYIVKSDFNIQELPKLINQMIAN